LNTSLQEAIIESGQEKAGQREFDQALNGKRVGEANMERASSLCTFLASPVSDQISGKLISAVWDPWETLPSHLSDLQQTDVYTLRRIVPIDRALKWGDR
jgi:3-oxoacyl-[acyl-carrier protein] reductase